MAKQDELKNSGDSPKETPVTEEMSKVLRGLADSAENGASQQEKIGPLMIEAKGMDDIGKILVQARATALKEKRDVQFTHNGRTVTLPFECAGEDLRPLLREIDSMAMDLDKKGTEGSVLNAEDVRKLLQEAKPEEPKYKL
jgi:hypothetical protein